MPEHETAPTPDEAIAPELVEPASQWPGIEEYRERLDRLQTRIRTLEANAKKLNDKIGDLQGTNQDAALQKVEEEQAALLLEAKTLRLDRIALIDAVPSEHFQESNQVRTELGLTIEDASPES